MGKINGWIVVPAFLLTMAGLLFNVPILIPALPISFIVLIVAMASQPGQASRDDAHSDPPGDGGGW